MTCESCLVSPQVTKEFPSKLLFQPRAVITWFVETLRIQKNPEGNPDIWVRPLEGTLFRGLGGRTGGRTEGRRRGIGWGIGWRITFGLSLTKWMVITLKKKSCWKTCNVEWKFTLTRRWIGLHWQLECWEHPRRVSKEQWTDMPVI